jgi:polar amino acid transport system permease protein
MEPVWNWFLWLYETTGYNLTIFYDSGDRGRFFGGFWTTIELSLICIACSLLIGIVGAWLQRSPFVWTRRIVHAYIQFFRNTPPLVQLYFFYFAVGSVMPRFEVGDGTTEALVSNYGWAVISLSFFSGAFNVEIFRAGIEAVPQATDDAAESLGFTRLQTYAYFILPLALRISLPALNNNLVNLVKATTIAYVIAVPELLYVTNQVWHSQMNVPELMNVLLLTFTGLIAVLVYVMHRWEQKFRIPGYSI